MKSFKIISFPSSCAEGHDQDIVVYLFLCILVVYTKWRIVLQVIELLQMSTTSTITNITDDEWRRKLTFELLSLLQSLSYLWSRHVLSCFYFHYWFIFNSISFMLFIRVCLLFIIRIVTIITITSQLLFGQAALLCPVSVVYNIISVSLKCAYLLLEFFCRRHLIPLIAPDPLGSRIVSVVCHPSGWQVIWLPKLAGIVSISSVYRMCWIVVWMLYHWQYCGW